MKGVPYELPIDQPFDLERTLRCGQGHRWRPVEGHRWVEENGHRRREAFDEEHLDWYSSAIHGQPVWIRQKGGPKGSVEFDTTTDALSMEAHLRWQFRLDDDIESIYADLRNRNDILAELVQAYGGLRVMRVNPWECLVFFILAARTPIEKTQQRMDESASAFSTGAALANGRHPFPNPEDVGSDSGLAILNRLDLGLFAKRGYVHEAGKAVERGHALHTGAGVPGTAIAVNLGGISNYRRQGIALPTSQVDWKRNAVAELRKIPGVGAKTADCVALFGLGFLDAFPVDTHILETLKSLYLDQLYAGYASQFLFIEGLVHRLRDERQRPAREY